MGKTTNRGEAAPGGAPKEAARLSHHPRAAMENPRQFSSRPYLRILFECCQVYQRIYRDRGGAYYQGRCPRCLRAVRFNVASNGTSVRDFAVY